MIPWLTETPELPRGLADRIDHGEPVPQVGDVFAVAP